MRLLGRMRDALDAPRLRDVLLQNGFVVTLVPVPSAGGGLMTTLGFSNTEYALFIEERKFDDAMTFLRAHSALSSLLALGDKYNY